ncbi:hypothetical protein GGH93_005561 [Coemansia aciculifera]|nr:hypothetical protein GGH93_005561 [Coemansia aciculifera]
MSIPEIAPPDTAEGVARQPSGKMRSGGNLFRGLKRVAKAVKSAASSTMDGLVVDDRYSGQQVVSPRQRSMTQQTHGLSPMTRVYSEQQQVHSRSIDLARGMGQQGSEDSSGSQDHTGASRLRRGNTTAMHRSPALSQSSVHSSYAGPMSYEAPTSTAGVPLESALLTARSADAVYGTAGAPLSRPAFALYPQQQRDRSMTLPSNGGSATPALPPRKSSIAVSQPVSPQTPGKINLDISGSPLFKPAVAAREQTTTEIHSPGERIHKQAVRNISMADMTDKVTAEKLMLPPPAVDRQDGQKGCMANTPLSRILLAGEAHATAVSGGGSSEVTTDSQQIGATLMPENDSGVLVDNGTQSKELSGAISPSVQSLTTSQASLPIRQQSRPRLESPPSPFSFGHSRYSLINQDGSLNFISYEFDQLDGYQKRLSNSAASLNGSEGAKGSERLSRKQNLESGWFWGSLASSSTDAHGRNVSPPARLSRVPFGPAVADAADSGNRHSKLMRKGRGSSKQENGSGDLGLMLQGSSGGRAGGHERNHSTSTTHSVLSAAASVPRNSESSGGGRNSSSGASRQAILQQQSYSHMSTPLTLLYRQASDNNPVVDNRLLRPTPGVNPFDQVYHSSIASMSLEQALTLIEGTTVGDTQAAGNTAAVPSRHRRMHKRSASVLNENELDEIMIQTAEMCHSIQSAIKLQRASESGLGRWISGTLGCIAGSDPPVDTTVKEEEECAYDTSSSVDEGSDAMAPVAHCLSREFVSADTSPIVAKEDQECHRRVPSSSSQASSVGLWTAGPEPRSASNSLDRVRGHEVPESVPASQDSIDIADPVAVPVAVVTPRRGSR